MAGTDPRNYTTTSVAPASSGTYVATENDIVILVDNTAGACNVTLLAPSADHKGRIVTVQKNNGSANAVTIAGASGNIDGGANTTLASGAFHAKSFVCDGSNFFTLTSF